MKYAIKRRVDGVLLHAANIINKGFCKGRLAQFRDATGNPVPCTADHPMASEFCMIGAIERAAQEKAQFDPEFARRLKNKAIERVQDVIGVSLPKFNDAPGRRKESVVEALRSA